MLVRKPLQDLIESEDYGRGEQDREVMTMEVQGPTMA